MENQILILICFASASMSSSLLKLVYNPVYMHEYN